MVNFCAYIDTGWEEVEAQKAAAAVAAAAATKKDALSMVVLDASAAQETLPERKHRTDVQLTPAAAAYVLLAVVVVPLLWFGNTNTLGSIHKSIC